MKTNTSVRLIKIGQAPKAKFQADSWTKHVPGSDENQGSLPVDYTVEGNLMSDIAVGQPIQLRRTKRNDVTFPGTMISSPITKIEGDRLETHNSIYLISILTA